VRENQIDREKKRARKTWGFYPTIFFTKLSPHHFDFPLPLLTALDLQGCSMVGYNHLFCKSQLHQNALEWQRK